MDPERSRAEQEERRAVKNVPGPKFSKRIEESPLVDGSGDQGSDKTQTYIKYGSIAGVSIIALFLIIFFGGRAITGYAVYSAMNAQGVPDQYATDMAGLANAKAAAEAQAADAQAKAADAQAQLATAQTDLAAERDSDAKTQASLQADVDTLTQRTSALKDELSSKTTALSDAAKRLCCVQRAYDSKINAYVITDTGVSCTSDGTGTPISC